jgi:hypothetical protein
MTAAGFKELGLGTIVAAETYRVAILLKENLWWLFHTIDCLLRVVILWMPNIWNGQEFLSMCMLLKILKIGYKRIHINGIELLPF